MKTLLSICAITVLVCLHTGFSQGFINLNFEAAKVVPIPNGDYGASSIATSNAVPGWTVYYGFSGISQMQAQMTYNNPALGSTFVSLWATNGQQIAGNYSVLLQGGLSAPAASISQTGLVPISSLSLLFEAQPGPGTLQVFLGGQIIPFNAISTGSNFTLYGGDISAYAGQMSQLTFTALNVGGGNNWNIDNIQFSSSAVPEPSILALGALGALLVGFRRWRQFRS